MGPVKNLCIWLFKSRGHTNFTYDLDGLNKQYLIAFVALISHKSHREIRAYVDEIEGDDELRAHIQACTEKSQERLVADREVRCGRRIGWYAFVRALKPKIVVETGVDKGLGAYVLATALLKNAQEGHEGHYYGIDINPKAGYLLRGRDAERGEVLYGDAVELLSRFEEPIDLFIE